MTREQDYTIDEDLRETCDVVLADEQNLNWAVQTVIDEILQHTQEDEEGEPIHPYGWEHVETYFETMPESEVWSVYLWESRRRLQDRHASLEDLYHRSMAVNTALQDELGDRQADILHLQEQVALARDLFDQARRLRGGLNEFVGSAREFQRKDRSVTKRLQVVQDQEER